MASPHNSASESAAGTTALTLRALTLRAQTGWLRGVLPCVRNQMCVMALSLAMGCGAEPVAETLSSRNLSAEPAASAETAPDAAASSAVDSGDSTAPLLGDCRVEARGVKFAWQFYHLPDGEEPGAETALPLGNTLRLKAGADVQLLLTSTDYVYTLTTPDGQKEIAVPDMIHRLRFTAPERGQYEFHTDPMCGWRFFHDDVQGRMEVGRQP